MRDLQLFMQRGRMDHRQDDEVPGLVTFDRPRPHGPRMRLADIDGLHAEHPGPLWRYRPEPQRPAM